jgi:hypothetical protein
MQKSSIVFFLLISLGVLAQDGKKLPSLKIPRIETPEPDKKKTEDQTTAPQYSLNKPFEPKIFKVPPKKYDPPQLDKEMQMTGGGSDLNVGKQYAEKLNKSITPQIKEGALDPKEFRRHQYFGEFVTESETISFSYRDFGEIDGDRVRVWVDGKVVTDFIQLDGAAKKIYIGLVEGINHIEIEAINEGLYTPNTGEFRFYDEQAKLITGDMWGLATGFKAKFNIRRVSKGTLKKSTIVQEEKKK